MAGRRGGIGRIDRRIGAEMARQLKRQLRAGRMLRKALVDADLEEERTVLVAYHDAAGDGRAARMQRDDLAAPGLGHCRGRAADEGGVAGVLAERGAALALPAASFERK